MAALPTIKQLKYLCAVAEHCHFGRAAAASFVSQSALSAAILELEQLLDAKLVERNNKGVLMTPAGEEVVNRARRLLTDLDDLVSASHSMREPFTGSLRLGVIPTIAPFILPDLLTLLRKKYPPFKLFIREDLSHNLVDYLQQGELDVLLLALPFAVDNVTEMPLFPDRLLLAFGAKDPVAKLSQLNVDSVKGRPLLLLEEGHCLRDHAMASCKLANADISIPYQATSLNTVVQMAANDIGITLLPEMAVKAGLIKNTQLKTRAFDQSGIERTIGLMWRKRSPLVEQFEALGDFIQQHCRK